MREAVSSGQWAVCNIGDFGFGLKKSTVNSGQWAVCNIRENSSEIKFFSI